MPSKTKSIFSGSEKQKEILSNIKEKIFTLFSDEQEQLAYKDFDELEETMNKLLNQIRKEATEKICGCNLK